MDQATAENRAFAKISGLGLPPEPQAAPPAPEPPTQEAPPEQPEVDTGEQPVQADSDQSAADSEAEEIEFDGIKFSLPKQHVQKVKDALMREADYTRKTQDISERSRVLSEQDRLFQSQQQFHRDSIDDIAQIRALDQAIAQYANVNWMGMQTDELMRTRLQYDQLKEARETANRRLHEKWERFNRDRSEQLKKLEQAGREAASRKIQGFNDQQAKDLSDYARKSGYNDQQIAAIFYNPLDVEMIWKAMQFDKVAGTKGAIQNRLNKAPPISRPGPSQAQKSEGEKKLVQFYAEKNAKRKEDMGGDILMKKMRI